MTEYYLAINGQQSGPFSKEELRARNIGPETLVWRSGMTEWRPVKELDELSDLFEEVVIAEQPSAPGPVPPVSSSPDNSWFAMFGERRVGPASIYDLIGMGLNHTTPVWHEGMPDWTLARNVPEVMSSLNTQRPNYGQNPQYGQQPNYGQNPQYGQQPNYGQNPQYGQQPNYGQNNLGNRNFFNGNGFMNRKDWLAPAIIATIAGFLCSCIGAIFGIIAIVYANKANQLYAAGLEIEAENANSTARTLTLIAFGVAALGLIFNIFNFATGAFSSLF